MHCRKFPASLAFQNIFKAHFLRFVADVNESIFFFTLKRAWSICFRVQRLSFPYDVLQQPCVAVNHKSTLFLSGTEYQEQPFLRFFSIVLIEPLTCCLRLVTVS